MKIVFWVSICFILYTYVGYPCLLYVWSKLFPKGSYKSYLSPEPLVSVIIAARNEEGTIGKRIQNLLQQDYPLQKIEIIVVSDGSTDATNRIVREFSSRSSAFQSDSPAKQLNALSLLELPEGKGKAQALNLGVSHAKGGYLIFTDCRQHFDSGAISQLLSNFSDPEIGCVSGELILLEDPCTRIQVDMHFYWDLEKFIRKLESNIDSVAGATGAIYAIRKSLFEPLPEGTLLDDVFIPMRIVLKGYRTVFDGQAKAYDNVSKSFAQEKSRKIRTLLGNYQLLGMLPLLLSPFKNRIFFRYLSHKVFRLFIPFFIISAIISSVLIAELFYGLVFVLFLAVLLMAIVPKSLESIPYLGIVVRLAKTFCSLNYFALLAFFYSLSSRNLWPKKYYKCPKGSWKTDL